MGDDQGHQPIWGVGVGRAIRVVLLLVGIVSIGSLLPSWVRLALPLPPLFHGPKAHADAPDGAPSARPSGAAEPANGSTSSAANSPPVLKATYRASEGLLAVFSLPGRKDLWGGTVNDRVPGTDWRIREVSLDPHQVTLADSAGESLTVATGQPIERPLGLSRQEMALTAGALFALVIVAGSWRRRSSVGAEAPETPAAPPLHAPEAAPSQASRPALRPPPAPRLKMTYAAIEGKTAVFDMPGQRPAWTGMTGDRVPGTSCEIVEISINPCRVKLLDNARGPMAVEKGSLLTDAVGMAVSVTAPDSVRMPPAMADEPPPPPELLSRPARKASPAIPDAPRPELDDRPRPEAGVPRHLADYHRFRLEVMAGELDYNEAVRRLCDSRPVVGSAAFCEAIDQIVRTARSIEGRASGFHPVPPDVRDPHRVFVEFWASAAKHWSQILHDCQGLTLLPPQAAERYVGQIYESCHEWKCTTSQANYAASCAQVEEIRGHGEKRPAWFGSTADTGTPRVPLHPRASAQADPGRGPRRTDPPLAAPRPLPQIDVSSAPGPSNGYATADGGFTVGQRGPVPAGAAKWTALVGSESEVLENHVMPTLLEEFPLPAGTSHTLAAPGRLRFSVVSGADAVVTL